MVHLRRRARCPGGRNGCGPRKNCAGVSQCRSIGAPRCGSSRGQSCAGGSASPKSNSGRMGIGTGWSCVSEIAGLVVGGVLRDGQTFPAVFEKRHQIQHAPMIDVRVGFPQAPVSRIRGKCALHVFVDFLLQIETHAAKRADRDIAANAALDRHIAVEIGQRCIGGIVSQRLPDSRFGGGEKFTGCSGAILARQSGARSGCDRMQMEQRRVRWLCD